MTRNSDGSLTHGSRAATAPATHQRKTDRPVILSFPTRPKRTAPRPHAFGAFIQQRRDELGLSIPLVSLLAEVSTTTLEAIESGQRLPVKIATVLALHGALTTPLEQLMALAVAAHIEHDEPETPPPAPLQAIPEYDRPGHWLVWSTDAAGECVRATATACECRAFGSRGTCAHVALVQVRERGSERAA